MISRIALGVLSATLAVAASPLYADPAASSQAAPAASMTYHIERHGPQVTVKDADEKTLTTFSTATTNLQTPTTNLQGVLIRITPPGAKASAVSALDKITLMLEDQNGRLFWSTPVPITFPLQTNVSYNPDVGGTLLIVNHQTEDASDSSDPSQPPPSRLTFVIGPDGRPLSFGDATHQFKYVYEANGFSLIGSDGKVLIHGETTKNGVDISAKNSVMAHLNLNQDGTGTMQLNGTNIPIGKVVKDGKTYSSFPWNGHKVLVDQSCSWSVTSDGDLTVNGPAPAKTTASK